GWVVRAGEPWHAVVGRNRRAAAPAPVQAAAGAPGGRAPPGGRPEDAPCGRSVARGHGPGPRGRGRRWPVPPRPVLSPQRRHDRAAPPRGTARGHRPPGATLRGPARAVPPPTGRLERRGPVLARAAAVAGQ